MPTSASSKFPVPKSWDELEVIVLDLLRREWADPFAVRHGRIGQRQDGVDIYGKPAKSKGAIHGVQVRGKTEQYGAKLTERELRDAVAEAQKFCPSLEAFYVVTSVPRDASVQKAARLLTE